MKLCQRFTEFAERASVRVVLDTNVLISGLLWLGAPHHVLGLAESGEIELCATPSLLEELHDALSRPKFRAPIHRRRTSVDELVASVAAKVRLYDVTPRIVEPRLRDRDDVILLACARAAQAAYIISGDNDLLALESVQSISILSPSDFLRLLNKRMNSPADN